MSGMTVSALIGLVNLITGLVIIHFTRDSRDRTR
jgi:hypothetical protein